MRYPRLSWFIITLLLIPAAGQARQSGDAATIAAVADSIAAEVLKGPVAGVAIGVARNGEIVFHRAYGMADVAGHQSLSLEDQHQIGSLTKQFTSSAILQLIEQGRMALDDPIQKYLPDFDTQGRTVTIHHLLNHTSGIRSYTSIYGMNPVPRATVLDTLQKYPFDFEPGERFLYNNSGYYLLGVILEAVTGQPYAEYMEHQIFEPLGLTSTSYCGYDGEPVPVGYQPDADSLMTTLLSDMTFPGAAGGLCSTVDDLLTWQRALVNGDVVTPESYARMTTPATLGSGDPMSYGYGLGVGEFAGHPMISHGGGIPGYNTNLAWYPADSIGVVILVNTAPGPTARVNQAVSRAALGLPRIVVREVPLPAAERSNTGRLP